MRKLLPSNFCDQSAKPLLLLVVCSFAVAPFAGCHRKTTPKSARHEEATPDESPAKPSATPFIRRIVAAWYKVPKNSLARRRAPNEFTAAHNKLPIGTRVLVTNPDNGKSVTVQITDRGIHDRRVKLDLCKEAAEELEVIDKGFAHLTMQVLDEKGSPGPSQSTFADN